MTLDRATVEHMLASEFRPDDELIDALAEDWLRKEEALREIARIGLVFDAKGTASKRVHDIARAALAPQTEDLRRTPPALKAHGFGDPQTEKE